MTAAPSYQLQAADPARSVFVTANAGSGKTWTLVARVARLLLQGARPQAILCVTYTKAAAAEMQTRLFEQLGEWAVADDDTLHGHLAAYGETLDARDLSRARRLFASALEAPGGLKIQTIHAFCEALLRRFPLEAGVSPSFQVMDDAAGAELAADARARLAEAALAAPDSPLGQAYERFAVALDFQRFEALFDGFAQRRAALSAWLTAAAESDGTAPLWARLGFNGRTDPETLEAEAVAATDWPAVRQTARALLAGSANDQKLGAKLAALAEAPDQASFADLWRCYCKADGEPLAKLATQRQAQAVHDQLAAEQERLGAACGRIRAARIGRDTEDVLTLAGAFIGLYEGQKAHTGQLDFGDLLVRVRELLTIRADAAWVLYKLDGGLDHILLDEAQDTAPEQWDILRGLMGEFFVGAAAPPVTPTGPAETAQRGAGGRTVFAVGDEKQSIYSFQGADPERMLQEAREVQTLVEAAGGAFTAVTLSESRRSTPEVLAFVDAAFWGPQMTAALSPALVSSGDPVQHTPHRRDGPGCVDLWPLELKPDTVEVQAWDAPVDQETGGGVQRLLAARIAREIKASLAAGEAVYDKALQRRRPATPGDVLILVRRRSPLFYEMIRALKREGVPVGGADRLKLTEHIAFADLLALARFCLYPQDDLTLAALLRSPLCDVDEAGLFDLAHGRRGSLWAALTARGEERPEWESARALLRWCRREAAARPPFDFYGRLLSRLDAHGRSQRERILQRLGREAEDALDAFLAQALAAEQAGRVTLETFAHALAAAEIDVKREQQDGQGPAGGEVRVMTVHGAKGLEAPIVVLPDTTTKAKAFNDPLLDDPAGGVLWAPSGKEDCPASTVARQVRDEAVDKESLRLLYVALTRARDRLILCGAFAGHPSGAGFGEGCWWHVCQHAFARLADTGAPVRDFDSPLGLVLRRYGADPERLPPETAAAPAPDLLPAWARGRAPADPPPSRLVSPSRLEELNEAGQGARTAPAAKADRFRRGTLIHRLLQLLPDLPPDRRAAQAERLLAREPGLTDAQRAEMAAAALGVLADPAFAPVFAPGSRAEQPVAGTAPDLPGGLAVSGRLDRLVVTPERVLVVDFKSNRPGPRRIEDADGAVLTQMALYVAVLRAIYPDRPVEAALVWTDGPALMPVPENLIAARLERLRRPR